MAKEYARKLYNSKQWKALRKEVLHRDRYNCKICYGRAQEVHHIIEVTINNIDDENITLNPNNLMCLCGDCHKRITIGYTGAVEDGYIFGDDGQVICES
jgi:5-methylcytosine-specific restriction endonuclease McrA